MKKRLLFIKKRYSFFGGAELYLERIISFLKDKYNIHIISENWPVSSGVTVHNISRSIFFSDLIFSLKVLSFLKKKKDFFDLVISFDRCLSQDIYRSSDGCHLRWLEQRKFFDNSFKLLSFRFNLKHKIIAWLEKKCLLNSKKIIVNSKMVLNDYKYYYGDFLSSKISICYNGVDLNRFYPLNLKEKLDLKRKLSFSEKDKILIFVGSGYKRKGLYYLLPVLSKLSSEYKLLVIGKDKNLGNLRSASYPNVFFLGPVKNILAYYQISDILLLPTFYDPFANVTLESLACGVPVITTIFNGASEILEVGKDGFILSDFSKISYYIANFIAYIENDFLFFSRNAIKKSRKFSLYSKIKDFLISTGLS